MAGQPVVLRQWSQAEFTGPSSNDGRASQDPHDLAGDCLISTIAARPTKSSY